MRRLFKTAIALALLGTVTASAADNYVKREVRSVWMATVWALDWPSTTGTSTTVQSRQKEEMTGYLDRLQADNFNAVYFQVRSMCDAMYESSYEPWSSYLTGSRGADPGWDPLEFVVEECHKRGLECHAWVNPYRWSTGSNWNTAQDQALQESGILLAYTSGTSTTTILNPGLEATRERIVAVCREIAENYDVDGIIFDDYFYPSGIPTDSSAGDYELWQSSGGSQSFGDWRRANVNQMVADVYNMIQEVKPYVKFGISPAGVACSSASVAASHGVEPCPYGSDWQYNGIFSDPVAWLEEGTIDYISPQIYWKTTHSTNPFGPLTQWWSEVAQQFGRHHYASHSISFLSSSNTTSDWQEVGKQLEYSRDYTQNAAPGQVYYSANKITGKTTSGLGEWLLANKYQHPSLTPAIDWKTAPRQSKVESLKKSGSSLTWTAVEGMRYAVYAIPKSVDSDDAQSEVSGGVAADYLLGVSYTNSYTIPDDYLVDYYYAVSVVDRYGNEYDARYTNESTVPADQVTLLSPINGAGVKLTAEFQWMSADAATYDLEIATDADFAYPVYEALGLTTNSATVDVTDLERECTYYWRVTTVQDDRYDVASETATFTTLQYDPIAAATLSTPANGSEIDSQASSVTFSWSAVDGAGYELVVATDAALSNAVYTYTTSSTSLTVPIIEMGYSQTLYWAVVTSGRGYIDTQSEVWSFTTPTVPVVDASTLYAPADGTTLTNNFLFEFSVVDAEGYTVQVATDEAFSDIVFRISSGWETSGNVVSGAMSVNFLPSGTYYWRVSARKTGCEDSFSEARELTLSNSIDSETSLGSEYGYRTVQDGSSYTSDDLRLVSLWTRSVKDGYGNIEFEQSGSLNRSFCVSDNVIYVSGRESNSSSAACYIDMYSALTGSKIGTIDLGTDVSGSYYPCNDVLKDSSGNIAVSNLTLNISTTPLVIYIVNPENGAITLAAECQSSTLSSGRVDHCSVYGSLTTGNFTVFAPVASTSYILKWTFSGSIMTNEELLTATGLYPSDAGNFGIAPRVHPVNTGLGFVNGGSISPMSFNTNTGAYDSFASATEAAPTGLNTNGFATFGFSSSYYFVYPQTDHTADEGFTFTLADVNSSRAFSSVSPLWTLPATGLGTVYSSTYDALADYEVIQSGRTQRCANIYLYVPGNGLAAYSLMAAPQSGVTAVAASGSDFTVRYSDGEVRTSVVADRIEVYSLTGALVASATGSSALSLDAPAGVYVVRAVAGRLSAVAKIAVAE